MRLVRVYWLGLLDYARAWRLQEHLARQVAEGQHPPALLLLEHPHTYTLGRQGHETNLLWDARQRAEHGVALHWVDRGGDITYHGPGQLVGYPILPLGRVDTRAHLPQPDYVAYLRRLEETLIRTLAFWQVPAVRVDGKTGVWLPPQVWARAAPTPSQAGKAAKIAAIGVKVDARGISRHGFALNVQPDMRYWEGIIGCGLRGDPVAALADVLSPVPSMKAVRQNLLAAFAEVFACQLETGAAEDLLAGMD